MARGECFARRFEDDLRFALAHGAPRREASKFIDPGGHGGTLVSGTPWAQQVAVGPIRLTARTPHGWTEKWRQG
jgi:hypothetical protein